MSDFSTHHKSAIFLSVNNLLLFLQPCVQEFHSTQHQDFAEMWAFMCQLRSCATWALHPLVMDTMGSACHLRTKICRDMLKDASANVRQDLMMAPTLSLQLVDMERVQ